MQLSYDVRCTLRRHIGNAMRATKGVDPSLILIRNARVERTWGICTLDWQVEQVPDGSRFYGVEVGHRGIVEVTRQQAHGGAINLTVG